MFLAPFWRNGEPRGSPFLFHFDRHRQLDVTRCRDLVSATFPATIIRTRPLLGCYVVSWRIIRVHDRNGRRKSVPKRLQGDGNAAIETPAAAVDQPARWLSRLGIALVD